MPFLHALTDYIQIAQENVEKLHTYGNYKKNAKFWKSKMAAAALLDLPKS